MRQAIRNFIRSLGGSPAVSILALLVSCCVSIIIYLANIENTNRIWIAIAVGLVLTILLRTSYDLVIQPIFNKLTKFQIATILIVSAILSLAFIFNISLDSQISTLFIEGDLLRLILVHHNLRNIFLPDRRIIWTSPLRLRADHVLAFHFADLLAGDHR